MKKKKKKNLTRHPTFNPAPVTQSSTDLELKRDCVNKKRQQKRRATAKFARGLLVRKSVYPVA